MEPLILKFKEMSSTESLDIQNVEYSDKLNLSVLKKNGKPAVTYMNLGTETFTKATGEGSDTDKSGYYESKLFHRTEGVS